MATEFVQILKALSDETRFELIKLLLTHDLCVGALAHYLRISEAAVSQHLKLLREAGLVKGEKRGYWTHYMVEKNKLNELAELLRELTKLLPRPQGVCIKKLTTKSTIARRDRKCVTANVSTRRS
jgi:DNA-binding transcriptional ArsR family regulator